MDGKVTICLLIFRWGGGGGGRGRGYNESFTLTFHIVYNFKFMGKT